MAEELSCQKSKYEVDMSRGSILKHLVRFSITVTLTGMLQLLYNTADTVVVGQFTGKEALAAVGSTGSLINLLLTMFIGLSVGASIVLAKHYGEGNWKAVADTSHTAIAVSAISGVFIGVIGYLFTESMLLAMGVPEDILGMSVTYMKLYFVSVPFQFVNVFGSAILRAVGDTKRPLYILIVSGVLNIILNLIFVIVFRMGVAGVAWGTVFSSMLSAYLVLRVLTRTEGAIRISMKKLRVHPKVLRAVSIIGLPAGLEGAMFGISNVMIQSAINSFGSVTMAGNSIAVNLQSFVYILLQSVNQGCITITSQNMGARNYRRVRTTPLLTAAVVGVSGFALSMLMMAFAQPLTALFNGDPEVLKISLYRMEYTFPYYFIFGIMQTFASQLRGMGHSFLPMAVSVTGICGIRVGWLYTFFAATPTFGMLLIGYPVSWAATMVILIVCYVVILRKVPKTDLCGAMRPETE